MWPNAVNQPRAGGRWREHACRVGWESSKSRWDMFTLINILFHPHFRRRFSMWIMDGTRCLWINDCVYTGVVITGRFAAQIKARGRLWWGSYHGGERHVAAVDPGQAKVGQLHLALTGHQNVLGLQVSVHHPVRVKEREAAQQLAHQVLQNRFSFQAEHSDSKPDHPSACRPLKRRSSRFSL